MNADISQYQITILSQINEPDFLADARGITFDVGASSLASLADFPEN